MVVVKYVSKSTLSLEMCRINFEMLSCQIFDNGKQLMFFDMTRKYYEKYLYDGKGNFEMMKAVKI